MNLKEGTENYRTKGRSVKTLNLQTEAAKTAYWKRIDRRRVGYWGVVSRKVKPLYGDEVKAIEKAIRGKAPGRLVGLANEAINSLSPEWEKLIAAVSAALIEDFGNETAEDLGAEKSGKPSELKWVFDPFSAAARAWITKNGAKSVKTILATNLDDVKQVILAGMGENLSTPQIARNIRQFYTDQSSWKAMRVARTEVCKASSFGNLEAARQSGVAKTKTWLSCRDERVRDEHALMDGETVGLNDKFSNGLEYPEEPNCRCVLTFQTGR